jgi:6-phosphofructokinase 1
LIWRTGGSPSPFDRNLGTKMAAKAADWIIEQLRVLNESNCEASSPDSVVLLGLQRRQYRFTPVQVLKNETDFK